MSAQEDSIRLVGAGDAILTRKLRTFEHDRFRELAEIVGRADASMVNLEVLLHDFDGYPTGGSTGTYMRAPPWVADELTWMGFDLFAAASNHSNDYSHGGMCATMEALEERTIPYAGLGRNRAAALEPAYVDTPSGRVALVAGCSTVSDEAIAGEQRRDMQGRPGVAPLRNEARYVVPDEAYERLQEVSASLGLADFAADGEDAALPYLYPESGDDAFDFPNVNGADVPIVRGDEYRVEQVAEEADSERLTEQVERARRQADWVVASLHAHEVRGGSPGGVPRPGAAHHPAEFVETFARAAIDAGADVFVGHGAHVLQGIEIYRGKPIFYDLGNFIFQNQLIERFPVESYERHGLDPQGGDPVELVDSRVYDADGEPTGMLTFDALWESVLPSCRFDDGEATEIELYPIDLMQEAPRPRRGRPIVASGEKADAILEHLAALSAPYGTEIDIEDGVGKIRL